MFGFFAVLFFVLAAFNVGHVWIFGTTALGLVFLALQVWIGGGITLPWTKRPQ